MISFSLYMVTTIAVLLIGVVYAFWKTIMPYHIDALESPWEDIDPRVQILLKALLNGGGYFGLSTGVAMLLILMIPFRAGELWAGYAVGVIGLIGALPLGMIVYGVKKHTAGNPPFFVMVIINLLLALGLLVFALGF